MLRLAKLVVLLQVLVAGAIGLLGLGPSQKAADPTITARPGEPLVEESMLGRVFSAQDDEQPQSQPHFVTLSWNPSTQINPTLGDGLVGYNVYRRQRGSEWQRLNSGPVLETHYTDGTAEGGKTYYYAARAVNAKGRESNPSNVVVVRVPYP